MNFVWISRARFKICIAFFSILAVNSVIVILFSKVSRIVQLFCFIDVLSIDNKACYFFFAIALSSPSLLSIPVISAFLSFIHIGSSYISVFPQMQDVHINILLKFSHHSVSVAVYSHIFSLCNIRQSPLELSFYCIFYWLFTLTLYSSFSPVWIY